MSSSKTFICVLCFLVLFWGFSAAQLNRPGRGNQNLSNRPSNRPQGPPQPPQGPQEPSSSQVAKARRDRQEKRIKFERFEQLSSWKSAYSAKWAGKQKEWNKKRADKELLRHEKLIVKIVDDEDDGFPPSSSDEFEIDAGGSGPGFSIQFPRDSNFRFKNVGANAKKAMKKVRKDRSRVRGRLIDAVNAWGLNLHSVECADQLSFCVMEVDQGKSKDTKKAVESSGAAVYAEEDQRIESFQGAPVNDPDYVLQWGLDQIQAAEAWALDNEVFGSSGVGSDPVVVAVIDSGVDFWHWDLMENVWFNEDEIPFDGIDNDNNGRIDDNYGWNFFDGDNFPMDDAGHGTHSAGTIGAATNNTVGIAGLAYRHSLIMPCKFMDGFGRGWLSGAIDCLDYAVSNGAKIASCSWGGRLYSQAMEEAIAEADANGMLTIAAVGNSGRDLDTTPIYPASFSLPSMIAVMATDMHDNTPSFTNYGALSTHIAAPGVDVYSLDKYDNYGSKSGSSMAAPHVSAAAAFVWFRFPNLTNLQVKSLIMMSAESVPQLQGKCLTGGRLNMLHLLQTAIGYYGGV